MPETKETSTLFNEKYSVIQPNSKVITATTKPKPKSASTHQSRQQTRPSSQSSLQRQIKQVDHKRDPRPGQLIQKKKNGKEKQKDKEK